MRNTSEPQTTNPTTHRSSRSRIRRTGGSTGAESSSAPLADSFHPALHGGSQNPRDAQHQRLQALESAPLLDWLEQESRQRGMPMRDTAVALGVTYGYLHQLRIGSRCTANMSAELLRTIARFLRVPPILVRVVAGNIAMRDFAWPNLSEDELVDAALERMRADPVARAMLPADLSVLPPQARSTLALLWGEVSGDDVLQAHRLPQALGYVQRCGLLHDDHLGELARSGTSG